MSKYWKIPPDGDAAFVAAMEDVLTVYCLPHDPLFPVVCMDESSKQLVGEVHVPIPAAPGHGEIIDHKYVRHGVAVLFVEVELLSGRRHVEVTERRTRQDWALRLAAELQYSGRANQLALHHGNRSHQTCQTLSKSLAVTGY